MIRTILQYPDERLRIVSTDVDGVTSEIRLLIDDMIETMIDANGIGLAAPQIGEHKRIVVIAKSIIEAIERAEHGEESNDVEEELTCLILVNPTITCSGEKVSYQEGCLSVPEYREMVERYSHVQLNALDEHGNSYSLDAEGLLAICIQHELDHLEGKLFIDRLSFLKRSLYDKKILKRNKEK